MAKQINARLQQKHDIEKNWLQANNFTPLNGEIIIYDAETSYSQVPTGRSELITYTRFKIGNGKDNVNDLPFVADFTPLEKNKLANLDLGIGNIYQDENNGIDQTFKTTTKQFFDTFYLRLNHAEEYGDIVNSANLAISAELSMSSGASIRVGHESEYDVYLEVGRLVPVILEEDGERDQLEDADADTIFTFQVHIDHNIDGDIADIDVIYPSKVKDFIINEATNNTISMLENNDTESGRGLSTEDFTTEEKDKLASIEPITIEEIDEIFNNTIYSADEVIL